MAPFILLKEPISVIFTQATTYVIICYVALSYVLTFSSYIVTLSATKQVECLGIDGTIQSTASIHKFYVLIIIVLHPTVHSNAS